ncbi:hypothetical protein D9757_010597 [Collybiopsis confluens]|uniref:FAD-binding FR-type domain-containing protein n=1 Tax=Collybiopsis confluens TaxID=2823264 RepID=A0A8H5GW47_9AGAR|nr:hypothetical protein D9757_010597 [Collybiopsis confluens]
MVKRSSGLDFSDRGGSATDHVDVSQPDDSHLERNKAEKYRMQRLWLASTSGVTPESIQPKNFRQRVEIWLINDGAKQVFFAVWIFLHMLVITFGFLSYQLKDNTVNARKTFGVTYAIARTAALVLHVDVIFILLPVCRNFISFLRRTALSSVVDFDRSLDLHKATGWSIVVFTAVHIIAHMVNFYRLAMAAPSSFSGGKRFLIFLEANFATGPGVTGWIMTACLFLMVFFAMEKRRKANFEWFWYTHHLFLVFFISWQFHGMFCMIKPDRPPYCSFNTIGVFWRYWLVGGVIWVFERILREVRSRHRTYISKVIQHPSNVMELQIIKEKTKIRAGQYIFLSCPEISYFQWHPFTLTSAPEEDYISVHIRVVGDFTSALAKAVGCDFDKGKTKDEGHDNEKRKKEKSGGVVVGGDALNRVLPRVMIDGPFGSASEDFLNYETVVLVGAGIGVTPFASILKSIWYRMNNFNHDKPTRLSKVYFTWVIRDFGSAEWFHSLLHAIEEQDTMNKIEINIYLTAKIKDDDINNIIVHDVGAERDTITSLRAPTHFGRPNWDRVFANVANVHPHTDVGVFFCGPPPLSKQLSMMCNKWSEPRGTRFVFGKENF